jgi:hypothetical protein
MFELHITFFSCETMLRICVHLFSPVVPATAPWTALKCQDELTRSEQVTSGFARLIDPNCHRENLFLNWTRTKPTTCTVLRLHHFVLS